MGKLNVKSISTKMTLVVTGTPVENHLGDLYTLLSYAMPGLLGPRAGFNKVFVSPREIDKGRLENLKTLTQPFILRRKKSDPGIADDLPAKTVVREDCSLTEKQVGLYEGLYLKMRDDLTGKEGINRSQSILTGLLRLKQTCVHPGLIEGFATPGKALISSSGKLQRLQEITEEVVAEGQSIVIFTQFAEIVTPLAQAFSKCGFNVLSMQGSTSKQERDSLVDTFNSNATPQVFITTLKVGGVGLNLVKATHIAHLDRWWNPAVEAQAEDRVHRIGQKENVTVHTLVAPGTLEDRIDQLLAHKKGLAESTLDNTNIVDLNDEQLSELAKLVKGKLL